MLNCSSRFYFKTCKPLMPSDKPVSATLNKTQHYNKLNKRQRNGRFGGFGGSNRTMSSDIR